MRITSILSPKRCPAILVLAAAVAAGCGGRCIAQTEPASKPVERTVATIHDIGGYTLTDTSGSGAVKLSGITYAGGSIFYAVGGGSGKLYTLNINVDSGTGEIESAGIAGPSLQLKDESGSPLRRVDLEGVALAGKSVYVADENGPKISRHDLQTGRRIAYATTASVPQLEVFSRAVNNRGWESLARHGDGSVLWTANEEALKVDGDLASTSAGTIVRLQRFDADLNATGQWAYVTDPIQGQSGSRFDRAGVVDLVALDDGRLLVLERSTGNGFRIQLVLVDFAGATDVSLPPFNRGLRGMTFTPVSKTRLFAINITSRDQVNSYFVGITLGPVLEDGSRSLILIADNGGTLNFLVPNNEHRFYALKMVP